MFHPLMARPWSERVPMQQVLILLFACLLLLPVTDSAWAKKGSSGGSHASPSYSRSTSSHARSSRASSNHVRSPSRANHVKTSRAGSHRTTSLTKTSHRSSTTSASGVQRDKRGRIARSQRAKSEFKKAHPCPSTGKSRGACPGYVIDHVQPLKKGGADKPSNMQWQTKEAAKQKDKWE